METNEEIIEKNEELVNEVEDTKDIKEEEPTVTESDDSEPTPTINLFANMFGGLV